MRIGVFGGSFDPCHIEHYNIAVEALKNFQLDKLIVIPAGSPPHKLGERISTFEDRFNMLTLIFSDCDKIEVSDYEGRFDGISYTYLTLEHLNKIYSEHQLFLLVGTDMLLDFPRWRKTKRILELAEIVVTPRVGENLKLAMERFEVLFKRTVLISTYTGGIISSTRVRIYSKLGLDISNLVSKSVASYIDAYKLYPPDEYYSYVRTKLPDDRRLHTAGVIIKAIEFSKLLGENCKKAEISALLHDVAKYERAADYSDFKIERNITAPVSHAFLGAHIAKRVLNIDDEDMLNAIKYHSTGRGGMSVLEKIIFLADLIEENRDYPRVDEIRLQVEADFEKGFRLALKYLYQYLLENERDFCTLTAECYDYYKI